MSMYICPSFISSNEEVLKWDKRARPPLTTSFVEEISVLERASQNISTIDVFFLLLFVAFTPKASPQTSDAL